MAWLRDKYDNEIISFFHLLESDNRNRPKVGVGLPYYDLSSCIFEHMSNYSLEIMTQLASYSEEGAMRICIVISKEPTGIDNEILIRVGLVNRYKIENLPASKQLQLNRKSNITIAQILQSESFTNITQWQYVTTQDRIDEFYKTIDKEYKEYVLQKMKTFGVDYPTLYDLGNQAQLTIVSAGSTHYNKIGETDYHFKITCKGLRLKDFSIISDDKYSLYYFFDKDENYRVLEAFILDKKEIDEDTVQIFLKYATFFYNDIPDNYDEDKINECNFDGEDYYGNYSDGDDLIGSNVCLSAIKHSFTTSKKAFEKFEKDLRKHTLMMLQLKTDVEYWG